MASSAATGRLSHEFHFRAPPLLRTLALSLGSSGLIVHLLWRAQYSFHGLTTTGLVMSAIMFAMEAFLALTLVLSVLADIFQTALKIEPVAVPELDLPSVDVFVLISDPKHLPKAAYSLAVASQLDYPRELTRLYLIGHGRATENSSPMIALADRTRSSWLSASSEAPSGSAINAAMARTGGSLVLVLNAGDAPTPDLLRRIAGSFVLNPRLAYCDIPVFSIDGDPMLTDIDVTQRLPNDPGHFFKSCLKSSGGERSSLGLNERSIWRRAALSTSGSLTRTNYRPDAIARIRAAEHNWQHGSVERPMIASLAPDTVRDYLHARLALRLGTIDAALSRDPLMARGLTFRERLSWLPALFASIQPFLWATFLAIPPLAVLLNVPVIASDSAREGVVVSLGALIIALLMSGALYAGIRTSLIAMWSELLESFLSAPSLIMMMRGRDNGDRVPYVERANSLLVILFALLLAGTTASIVALNLKPAFASTLAAPAALTIFTACFVACLLGAIAEPRQRRLSPRMNRRLQAELLLGGETFFGRLADISVHGARFIADELVDLPVRAIAGIITLNGPTGKSELPVQLSRQSEASGRSAFGLSFTGRTVGEFATVVRLAHRSGDAYADLCDSRARPSGVMRLLPLLTLRGVGSFFMRLVSSKRAQAEFVKLERPRKRGTQ
ncbi:MAG: PilZ domain-containing protein [Micropepsaceae bacterium]